MIRIYFNKQFTAHPFFHINYKKKLTQRTSDICYYLKKNGRYYYYFMLFQEKLIYVVENSNKKA